MANLCSNTLVFDENHPDILQIKAEIIDLDFDGLYMDPLKNNVFEYNTPWQPNVKDILPIAEKYKCDFTLSYEEMGCCLYGRYTYEAGELTDIWLTQEDIDQYEFNEETNMYIFDGEEYESSFYVLAILLERKEQQHENI